MFQSVVYFCLNLNFKRGVPNSSHAMLSLKKLLKIEETFDELCCLVATSDTLDASHQTQPEVS